MQERIHIKIEHGEVYSGEGKLQNWEKLVPENMKGEARYFITTMRLIRETNYLELSRTEANLLEDGSYNLSRPRGITLWEGQIGLLEGLLTSEEKKSGV